MNATELAPPTSGTFADAVFVALKSSDTPLTFGELKKTVPTDRKPKGTKLIDAIQDVVAEGQRGGRIFAWTPKGVATRYWTRDEKAMVEKAAMDLLTAGDQPKSAVVKELFGKVSGSSAKQIGGVIDDLVEDQRLYVSGNKLSRNAPDPLALMRKACGRASVDNLEKLGTMLAKAHVTPDQLFAILRTRMAVAPKPKAETPTLKPFDLEEMILKGMLEVSPNGGPVEIVELRKQLTEDAKAGTLSRVEFERTVRELAERGQLTLHRHSDPHALSHEEREQLMTDGHGAVCVTMAQK